MICLDDIFVRGSIISLWMHCPAHQTNLLFVCRYVDVTLEASEYVILKIGDCDDVQ